MDKITYQKQAPVVGHYHTVVCGGGPAGWVAAVASARAGRKTALIERFGFLGGTATTGFVVPISGFFHQGRQVVGGIGWELVERMVAASKAQVELPKGHVSFDPEYYKLAAQEMVAEAGVDLYTNSYMVHMTGQDRRIESVIIESKNGAEALTADYFIDATGDGDLCHMAGVEMLECEVELQPLSMCFLLGGVDLTTDLLKYHIHHDGKHCKQSIHTEIHDYLQKLSETRQVPQFGGPWFNAVMSGDLVAVNITRAAADATDRAQMTAAESKMRKDAFVLLELLREHYPEFKNAYIAYTAVQGGVRETRRIKALHTVTGAEMKGGVVFPDVIALGAHPMDIHYAKDNSQTIDHLPIAAGIPYRSIVPAEYDNLLVAGRCLSADRTAYASVRVQATLMAVGQAAGIALAMCNAGDRAAEVDIDALHENMKLNKAIF